MADIVFPGKTPSETLNSQAMPTNADIVLYKGDYARFFITIKDTDGNPIDLTGKTPKASLKRSYSDQNSISFTTTISSSTVIEVYLPSSVSKSLVVGSYIWDLQLTDESGDARTYLAGDVTVMDEVTT